MINMTSSIIFNTTIQTYLNSLNNPSKIEHDSWSHYDNFNNMKAVKRTIKVQLLKLQNKRCAYCMQKIDTRSFFDGEREHFADKVTYPLFTFEEKNLLLSCITCNKGLKKRYNTIIAPHNVNYSLCNFNIVHPILDNVDDHICFQKHSVIKHKTPKGLATIRLFSLHDHFLTEEREKEILLKEKQESLPFRIKKMIQKVKNYVRK